jgi:hypothetical protein
VRVWQHNLWLQHKSVLLISQHSLYSRKEAGGVVLMKKMMPGQSVYI